MPLEGSGDTGADMLMKRRGSLSGSLRLAACHLVWMRVRATCIRV